MCYNLSSLVLLFTRDFLNNFLRLFDWRAVMRNFAGDSSSLSRNSKNRPFSYSHLS